MVWYVRYACPYPPQPLTWLWGGRGGGETVRSGLGTTEQGNVSQSTRAHSLDQQQKDFAWKNQFLHIEQSKSMKLTIDTNIQLMLYKAIHFTEGPQKIEKIFYVTL
jgi:hypothetical protein